MKQILSLLLALLYMTAWAASDPQPIPVDTHPREDLDNEKIFRTPAKSLVEVSYDSGESTVTTVGNHEIDAEVYLYNEAGEIEDSSPCVNSTLRVTSDGPHTILIITAHWYAIGHIEI